jgi:hypothetical protein
MQQPPPGRVSAAALLDTLGIPAAPAVPAASSASNASAAAVAAAAAGADVDEEPRPNETPVERDLRALFEARRPLRPVMQGSSAPVLQRSLNAELTCPVCLGIIRDCTAGQQSTRPQTRHAARFAELLQCGSHVHATHAHATTHCCLACGCWFSFCPLPLFVFFFLFLRLVSFFSPFQ